MAGLWDFVTGLSSQVNPAAWVGDAVANYRSLFGTRMVDGQIVPGEVDRAAQPLTSEWFANKAGVDATDNPAYNTGAVLPFNPATALKSGAGLLGTVLPAAKLAASGKKVTQTWKGIDGIERANLDDRNAALVNTLPTKGAIPLGDLMQHDDLYKIYPDMKNIPVERMPEGLVKSMGDGTHAAYATRNGKPVIYLNPKSSPQQWLSSLLHEGGHDIQRKEGMLGGANPVDSTNLANKIREEYTFLSADNPKKAERVARQAKKDYGIDVTAQPKLVRDPKTGKMKLEDPIAVALYVKQQGEADNFAMQAVHNLQMQQKKHVSAKEFQELPAPPFSYKNGQPINQKTIFEDIFGYSLNEPDNVVDLGVNGVRGMNESTADRLLGKNMGL